MTTAVTTRAGEPMSSREAETYQRLRAHLDILNLGAAAEALTTVLDAAHAQDLSLISAMERLLATEVAAVHARRHAGLVRFARCPCRTRSTTSTSPPNPGWMRS